MASYVPVVKNGASGAIFYVGLIDQSNTKLLKANPTIAAGDFKVSIDGGAFADLGTLPAATPASGRSIKITLSQAEVNGDNIVVQCVDAAGAEWCDLLINIQTAARQIDNLAYPATSGRSMVVDAAGLVDANVVKLGPTGTGTAQTARDVGASVLLSTGTGAGQLDFTSGVVKANATQWLSGTIPAVNVTGVPKVDMTHNLGTALYGQLFGSLVTGTSDSGTTSTMVDAARTENDAGFWKDCWILFTSGTIQNELRLITGFDPATDTITFAPVTSSAVGTQTYAILPAAGIDIRMWAGGLTPSPTVTGVPKVDVGYWNGDAVPTANVAGVPQVDVNYSLGFALNGHIQGSLISGTSDSGTTTTLVDADRTESATDFWKGSWIRFTTSPNTGEVRLITAFNPATDTITFTPAVSSAIGASGYSILPAAGIDVRAWTGNATATTNVALFNAADLRSAEGLASANLDTQLAAIKAKTDFIVQGLQKNVAFANFQVFMVSSIDHVTGVEGLTVLGYKLRAGDALFSSLDNAVTELDAGLYQVNLTANDLNADIITLGFVATGADTRTITIITKP